MLGFSVRVNFARRENNVHEMSLSWGMNLIWILMTDQMLGSDLLWDKG